MNNYMIPTDEKFVEEIAKAIARNRLQEDTIAEVNSILGDTPNTGDLVDELLDRVFELLWAGNGPRDITQKIAYRRDALAAISAINLKLITRLE